MGTLATLAAEEAAPLVLWGLKAVVSIPAAFVVCLIHRDMVPLEAGRCFITNQQLLCSLRERGSPLDISF